MKGEGKVSPSSPPRKDKTKRKTRRRIDEEGDKVTRQNKTWEEIERRRKQDLNEVDPKPVGLEGTRRRDRADVSSGSDYLRLVSNT